MSDELTPEDLEHLRVRLDRLLDFDAVGLWVDFFNSPEGCLVVAQNDAVGPPAPEHGPLTWDEPNKQWTRPAIAVPAQVRVVDMGDPEGGTTWWAKAERFGPTVTALHTATRDRLARWCAVRLGRSVGPTGPCLGTVGNSYEGSGWGLLGKLGNGMCIFMRPDWLPRSAPPPPVPDGESMWIGVPALADLDPRDPRMLPDGTRYVDAAALVAIAVHLGSTA